MTMHNEIAISIKNVSKIYKLYQNNADQLRDLLKLKTKHPISEHYALKNINVEIKKGQRLAIVGRNGAGKSTLLKMLTGNFKPTLGNISINGKVQALMNMGVGFHPEFTGLENIKASLNYNGLTAAQIKEAIEDIIDFVELGDYIHQPVKTYSLGMQSRLYFATATAIKPEILIIDEVLGAGDAYFSAKSADRMKNLTNSGCTLLLVSASILQSKWLREKLLKETLSVQENEKFAIERWPTMDNRLQIRDVRILNESNQIVNLIKTREPIKVEFDVIANEKDKYDCYFVILIFAEDGRWISRHCSAKYELSLDKDQTFTLSLLYNQFCLGNGKFVFSAALYKVLDLNNLGDAQYYDLLSRCFEFTVVAPHKDDLSLLHLPATWQLELESKELIC